MKRYYLVRSNHKALMAVLVFFLVLGAYPASGFDPDSRGESDMVQEVRASLEFTHRITMQDIHIFATAPGAVTLSGQVPTKKEKILAVETARKIQGVQQLTDHLTVEASVPDKSGHLKRRLEQDISDDISLSLGDDVSVRVAKEKVSLEGVVESWKDDQKIIVDAFNDGAKNVVSRLRVRDDLAGSNHIRNYDRKPLG